MFAEATDLVQQIVKSGRVDSAASVVVGPNAATGLLAAYVADGALLDKILHSIAKTAMEDHPELDQFVKLDVEKIGLVNFHEISLPIPQEAQDRANVVRLIGEKLDIVIGVGKENVYVAAGRDAMATLKTAIEASKRLGAKATPPLQVSLGLEPVAAVVGVVGKPQEKAKAKIIEAELKKTQDKNHVILQVRPISNGVQVHLEVQQGVLRVLGRLVAMGTAQSWMPAPRRQRNNSESAG